jgi:hypothetical protein
MTALRERRLRTTFYAALAGGLMGALALPGVAQAAPTTVSDTPSPAYQTNGQVFTVLTVGNRVYIGGDFTSVRPAGAPAGTGEVGRNHLAAFSATTGNLLSWNPGANNRVNTLAASPSGKVIYAGGGFLRLGGENRHHLGAVTAKSGQVTSFHANTNGRVLSIATHGKRVYVGGHFKIVRSKKHPNFVALRRDGRPVSFGNARANAKVRAVAVSPSGKRIYIGGGFTKFDGKKAMRIVKVTNKGKVVKWKSHPKWPIWELAATAHRVYAVGNGAGGHAASYTAKGKRRWLVQTDGNVRAVTVKNHVVYAGGNFEHVCVGNSPGGRGFNCPHNLATRHKLVAFGTASGKVRAWDPDANSALGVSALATSANSVHAGGAFTTVHKVPCQGYARFDMP